MTDAKKIALGGVAVLLCSLGIWAWVAGEKRGPRTASADPKGEAIRERPHGPDLRLLDALAPVERRDVAISTQQPTLDLAEYLKGLDPNSDAARPLLMGGVISREAYGVGYDSKLDSLVMNQMIDNVSSGSALRGLRFCGLDNEKEVEELRTLLAGRAPGLGAELDSLLKRAEEVSITVADFFSISWSLGVGISTKEHNGNEVVYWRGATPSSHANGLLQFGIAASAGDRAYNVQFNSADHPQLDASLLSLQVQKDLFWSDVSQLP